MKSRMEYETFRLKSEATLLKSNLIEEREFLTEHIEAYREWASIEIDVLTNINVTQKKDFDIMTERIKEIKAILQTPRLNA